MRVNTQGYLERASYHHKPTNSRTVYRCWWLVKSVNAEGNRGMIKVSCIYLPQPYVGKRVRFKVEVIDE